MLDREMGRVRGWDSQPILTEPVPFPLSKALTLRDFFTVSNRSGPQTPRWLASFGPSYASVTCRPREPSYRERSSVPEGGGGRWRQTRHNLTLQKREHYLGGGGSPLDPPGLASLGPSNTWWYGVLSLRADRVSL
jgi:hypothetical protein